MDSLLEVVRQNVIASVENECGSCFGEYKGHEIAWKWEDGTTEILLFDEETGEETTRRFRVEVVEIE